MALYQPTNIIPSSYTKGTVDVNDKMEISWRVNGNSAMTAFQIDFYLNDANSTPVISTGKKGITPEEQKQLGLPFYGTDRFGRPQFFTWNSKVSWEDKGFVNGNEYKYKITQWYKELNEVAVCELSTPLENGKVYYFEIPSGEHEGATIVFTAMNDIRAGTKIYFSVTNSYCWFERGNRYIWLSAYINPRGGSVANATPIVPPNTLVPPDGVLVTGTVTVETINEILLIQTSNNLIITKDRPILTIYQSDEQFNETENFPNGGSIATSIVFFKATYEQGQGDPIRWIRWQVATATYNTQTEKWVSGDILQDTGAVYTPTLNFEYNGFFNEQSYAIRAIGESESDQECNSNPDTDGWIFFTINIENQSEYRGEFTLQCLNKENAALLEWSGEEIIPIIKGDYVLNNGSVELKRGSSLTWGKPNELVAPWVAALNISLQTAQSYLMQGRGAQITRTFTSTGFINSINVSNRTNVSNYTTTISNDKKSCTVTLFSSISSRLSYATITLNTTPTNPLGQIGELNTENGTLTFSALLDESTRKYSFTVNDIAIEIPQTTNNLVLLVTPTNLIGYSNGTRFLNQTFQYTQSTLNSIQINGGTNGATFNCVTVYKGDISIELLDRLYSSTEFKPTWTSSDYSLYMTANFVGNIDGGTVAAFRVYRQEIGKKSLTPVLYTKGNVSKVKDYGIVSRRAYTYWLYEYDSQNAFLKGVQCKLKNNDANSIIATCFKNYSLLVCDYDETNDEYHVRKQYLFALNLAVGSVGNNNSPTLNANFTRYPTRMPSTQNYASGTLQGLIGAIYTVPALIEQIGNYKYTAKPSTMDYFDSVDLEQELYDLSTAPYQLFLRDMKGRLRMVATNGAITMTTNIKQKQQSISISFPWVEIGDASDVTIIQTPDDYGWNNDNQVLDVSLDVDVETGELSATYPYPYNGTKFYLTGANKETLTAKTPLGITPAQFNLSEVAEEPDDGELTATVKFNREDN